MTDQEILDYSHTHRCVYYDDLKNDVIDTSPQIVNVIRDVWYDHIIVITPSNHILFFEKFKLEKKDEKE